MNRRSWLATVGLGSVIAALQACSDAQHAPSMAHAPSSGVPSPAPLRSSTTANPADAPAPPRLSPQPAELGSDQTTPVDPLLVEKLLYNLGYQSNLAPRIRQDLNIFAMLVPELKLFTPGEKLDRDYLLPGIVNGPLFSAVFSTVLAHADPVDIRQTNDFVKSPLARAFIGDFWSALYDGKNFIAFMSTPFEGSQWRREALVTLNRLWFLDSMQASTLRPLAPVLLSRLRLSTESPGVRPIDPFAASLSFFRTAWAARHLTDDDLYSLIVQSGQPGISRTMSLIAGSFGAVCQDLGKAMDMGLPRDLSSFKRTTLESLRDLAP